MTVAIPRDRARNFEPQPIPKHQLWLQGSRKKLCVDAVFGPVFVRAKQRVAQMDIPFVEEGGPTRQAPLEIYVATALEAHYNDFDDH